MERRNTDESSSSSKKEGSNKQTTEFPTRGYYAELLADLNYAVKQKKLYIGAHKRTNFLWQIKTEAHAPILRQFVQPERKAFLAPAERWMTFDEDKHISFPVDTFKPKVQLQHEVEPKTLPRNVAIERRRREYQGQRLKTVLDKRRIELKELLPIDVLRTLITSKHEISGLYSWTPFLPLELFDNEDYDIRTPESWLDHGMIDGVKYPLPGEALVPNADFQPEYDIPLEDIYCWVNVAVTDYNFETKMWSVLTLDGLQRTFELPRLRVMFKAEDPANFARRIWEAIVVRFETENKIRYDFFLDCLCLSDTASLSRVQMEKILLLVSRAQLHNKRAENRELLETLKEEIGVFHKRTIAELEFRHICEKHGDHTYLRLPELEPALKPHRDIKTGMRNFKKMRDYFRWYNIYVIPETYIAMSSVVGECLKVGQMTLFNANYGGRALVLEEFESIQTRHNFFSKVIKQLTGPWLETLVFNIRMSLGDLGKGWFDLNVKVFRTYEISKLKRLMELIKFRMQHSLRLLVLNSLNTFANLVETPCAPCLNVEEDFVWGSYLKASPFVPKCPPLFSLQLKMDEHGPFYTTPTVNFGKVLLKLFDNAIRQTHQIKQVHPFLLGNLRFPKDLNLSSVGLLADEVCESRERFLLAYEKSLIPLHAYAREYKAHVNLYTLDVLQYIENYKSEQHTAVEIKDEVSLHFRQRDSLEVTLPTTIVIGPFLISIDHLRTYLITKRQELAQKLLDMFAARLRQAMVEVLEEYKLIMSKLFERPESIEHIFEIRDWMETIPMSVRTQEELCKRYLLEYEILDHFWYALPNDDFENKYEAIAWPFKIQQQIEGTELFLKEEEERFLKLQINDEQSLTDKIDTLTAQVVQMSQIRDFSKIHETAVDMRRVWKTMKEAQEQGQLLNQRQKMFGVPIVPFDNLTKLIREFEPYKNLWGTASDWLRSYEMWMDNPILNVDADSIESCTTEMYKMMVKLIKVFADIEAVQSVAVQIKNEIDDFKPLIPLIQSLRNPGMRQRHWHKFEEETGITLMWTPIITFNDCLSLGIREHSDLIIKIAESASKEYSIEQTMNKMKAEWESNLMELNPYKNTGTYIMKISDEIQQMLDDHIVLTQQISFSPFKGPFDDDIDEWEEKLRITAEVIEEWMDVQKQWMYLEPIFTSADITKQLPVESKKYNSMERTWRRIMRNAHDTPNIIEYCGDRALLESLRDCNHILQVVQKGLSEYLEVKRTVFPRLYFLSDDELLEILSQARNPLAVQPHLRKCFENIARLTFESDLQITEMFSAEEECVSLEPKLYPEGNVEKWLVLVESSMKNTVRTTLGKSLDDMDGKERKAWVLCWPGQVVIACSQAYWTAGVETGIRTESLDYFLEKVLLVNLDDLRSLVKGSLTFLQREILSALIVIEVHSRDVTQNLVDSHIFNVNDFDWISQLRYYWVGEDMKVRAVNAEFQYGYEYLGNSGRLVITPLTDRCYLTLTGALHLKFGGAPAGPAGTGKTETTKDLAKAMAIQCVVFNCSDQLDFMAMGKFFKGLASSGAWACFDEFNRIDIEVLSVVAQQIATIQKAQQACLDRFLFEGSEIVLKQSCAVFITMNPGYAGRTELPDNLKALFRPVSMMVPNYTLIAEISLFSFGFSNAKQLANKITTTFKLSSEQLSSQDHYDFGMRAVKTVIAVAGNLKREKPNMDERQIVLRALRDVNVPKFLKDDLILFNGIVSDLFPRMVEEAIDYGVLEQSIRASCLKLGQDDVNDYVKKVIQLYETTVVRHGLMLVGPTGSGKTKCYEILKNAMTALKGKPQPSGYPFMPVHTYVMNPKSITMGQLYGEFDLQTHEWTDGILPSLVRLGINADDKDKRWYIFDGPVDAVWIENMNTVLDDNKKLCLSSGEIIKLREGMTMVFEVADLAVASPATVSRCGMVYLEPGVLGLRPFITCWAKRLPELAKPYADDFKKLFDHYVLPAIEFVRSSLKEILTSVDSALLISFLRLMDFRLGPLAGRDNKPPPSTQYLALIPGLLTPWVIFSLVWSIGCTCDNDGRIRFDQWLKDKMAIKKSSFPSDGLVYDYKLHDGGFTDPTSDNEPAPPTWRSWLENIEQYKITADMKYSDIEIPTVNNIRNAELMGIILYNENNVLCIGPTGTGKTLTVIGKLSRNMHKKFICDFMCFSARTTANQTQDLIDSKLDRRRKGVFGPPVLKRQIFFIDDFNMPALEVYGAQPPIELIRQWMDFGGWYDRKNIGEFRTIIDINFAAAMGPPGGGRNPVTARLLRHFHFLTFLEMEEDSTRKIFGTILHSWISRAGGLVNYYEAVLSSTLVVYVTILRELLPTPAKTHYTFNLRDLSKIFQGILMFIPESLKDVNELIRLWYHECCRVFQDRLVNDEDRDWFDSLLRDKIQEHYDVDPAEALGKGAILFGDFLDPTQDAAPYIQIKDFAKLEESLNFYLQEYNAQSTKPMKLVLFLDAISHVCRISRIIRQPMGNALLLGMGGSGRQSLTRLSAFMAEFGCFQIVLSTVYGPTDWRDDMKNLMIAAGLKKQETVFLFSDTQIKMESFLEDLNNMLNSGDIPNIYQPDELDKIYQGMKGILQELGLAATKSNLFSVYQKQVRSNLHCVITMSPIGEIFRARLRQFPALVNCCTIDWFSPWPDSALQSVALQFLNDVEDLNVSEEVLEGIVMVFQYMHASVVEASELFKQELSRHNYVTPTSYLELLSSYTELMNKKKGSLTQGVGRLKTGLGKLQSTAEEVKILQVNLTEMKPALEVAAKEAEIMIVKIAADTAVAEETKAIVEKEEFEASKKAMETQTIAEDAQRDLDEAMPALMAAEASLKSLNKNDITEVRSMKRPPAGVVYVIEAICIVKNIKPNKVPGIRPGEKILDYWEPGRNMLADPGAFLTSLMNFDKDSITEEMIEKLKKYVEDPLFTPAKIAKISKACTSLCMWVHAMYKFYFVNKAVAPKKAALKQANEDLAKTERALAAAKAKMKEVMDGLQKLQIQLEGKIAFKQEKEQSMAVCEDRMNRAVRLINGLSGERVRWLQTIADIEANVVNVTGDILICSGCVAYLTPFTDRYRRMLFGKWLSLIEEKKIPFSPNCNPVTTLGEPVQIRLWQLDGLPRDYLSTENAVLVSCSRRWPLFIDPQGQANKWVKNMGKQMGLTICKLADKDLMRTIESAIRFGKAVLIENVGMELDPALDPVLLKQVYMQSGTLVVKLGDVVVPYDNNFKLFITTKLPNPHYTPEVSIKVLLVNFTLVPSGLQDQLLALVVMQERPDLEEQRSQIVVGIAQMNHELKEIQDRILLKLSTSEGSPLDDLDFIVTLEASKVKSDDIKNKVESAEITQIDIDNTRALYIPVANRAQILFFCLADLSNIDPMYQYSLEWFVSIFISSMAETEKTAIIEERVKIINDYFTFSLYSNVCRSLFERNKLHFAFLLCIRILMDSGEIDPHEWHHFLAGGSASSILPNPAPTWLSSKAWQEILALESLPKFKQFIDTFPRYADHYKHIFESLEPHRLPLPQELNTTMDEFQKIIVLKSLRPDKVTNAMQDFLSLKLGQQFIEPQSSDLSAMFKESGPTIPLIFVLSTGTDPAAELYKFADRMKFSKRMFSISLGQGQGPMAEKLIQSGSEVGSWVFFQNCHLAPSWMPRLERIIESIPPEAVHRDFRLWLTSTPSPHFPVAILQNGSKMTIEPPSGIKANMMRAYRNQVSDLADFIQSEHPKAAKFKLLVFSLCLFHGVVLERRKFGPLGFNIPYEFTDGDLKICISQLHMFLLEYVEIPFKVLTYTAGHINYSGRVTDDWDRRCLMNVLADYYKMEVVDPNYVFDKDGSYRQSPTDTVFLDYLEYIKTFPINDDPELFGLHPNADITFAQSQTYACLSTLLKLQPKQVGGAAASQEDVTASSARTILAQMPPLFNLELISKKYPVKYEESLNTVIIQEAIRYNKLLTVIKFTLNELLRALKGLVVMSEALERMTSSLFSNIVPALWASKAYPSLKPLAAWVTDLKARVTFLNKWVDSGIPPVFWISGFYFPQAFLTGTLQNFARKYIMSIDSINFGFQVLPTSPTERPKDGCCIYGLFLEGARWNYNKAILDESNPKELYTNMPVVWLIPEESHKKPEGTYECPVYKTLTRAGTLSTTGHSTNYVLAIEVPTEKSEPHWIKRGVALICALDY
ncbi:dynein heavy chain 1, axonemal-like [Anoplophora glabripennis]|uniref:dynein heavy chain 1, axonemal-like n=1 Tax=Anoplophora glabripennis TaxID=217634 RepID=UPI000C78FA45|nr:dynein heavy chain 1, axonemal-like [Anoplophora glabripennis]